MLAHLHGLPASEYAATAGLPLHDGRLLPSQFERAAQRVGLRARLVRRDLSRLDALVLPAVLLLADDRACVLLEPPRDGTAHIQVPDNPEAETRLPVADLEALYAGYAILASPAHRYDARTPRHAEGDHQRHWFWGALAANWRIYRDVMLATVLINVFAIANPLFVMNVYDRVVPNQAIETLWVLAVGVGVMYLFDFVLRGLRGRFVDVAGSRADIEMSSRLYERVLGLRLDARPASAGAFANNLREFDGIREFFASLTLTAFVDVPFSLLFLLTVWWVGGALVLVPLTAIPILLLYGLFAQPRLRRAAEQGMRASAQKNATLVEALVEAETVRALGVEGRIQGQLEASTAQSAHWGVLARGWALSVSNLATFLQQFVSVGVVVLGVYMINDGVMSLGALIASVILSGRAVAPLAQIAGLLTRYFQASTALQSLNDVMQMPVERPPGKVFVTRPAIQGSIEFDKVTFTYPGQEVAALKDASFGIGPGERVAIIGRVGSGKTTINRLIAGLYQAQEGAVRIDGVDMRQLDPGDLRHNISYVSQDSQLLFGTIRDNLSMGLSQVDDERIVRAAQLSGVAEFVNRHPLGFDMPVGEHGSMLSGGQRQAVGLARALVQDAPVLLLDEPTGSMDNSSEEHIKRELAKVADGKTVVLITHRASLLDLVDRVIVLDAGSIVADGPKAQVLEALRAGRIKQTR
ncbi:MAG: type I secretion system permease/ATPase [Chromatiaceae bacterium]|nr:type I secretion system permease/ATPase [Gammaproteobacteria bacterium]MCP5300496.1 type I secretion system permease/ATPase [Chromatiaceae bacterium]MCP5422568.1 type I secretion system permease/ATPase [Chromatiaceae bacterium]